MTTIYNKEQHTTQNRQDRIKVRTDLVRNVRSVVISIMAGINSGSNGITWSLTLAQSSAIYSNALAVTGGQRHRWLLELSTDTITSMTWSTHIIFTTPVNHVTNKHKHDWVGRYHWISAMYKSKGRCILNVSLNWSQFHGSQPADDLL